MALDSKNNIKSVFIVDTAVAALAVGTQMLPGSAPLNSVSITNVSNTVVDAATVVNFDKIKIVKDRGANLPLQQVTLSLSEIAAWSGVAGVAAVEQVSYLGYDGVSGNMDATSNNFFIIKLEHLPNSFIYGKRPANYKYGTFQSTNGSSALINATGLVKSLVQNFKPNRNIDWRVFTELTSSGARIAAGASGTLTFTKYSKTVIASAVAATNGVVVGDYISSATGFTSGVYKITAIDGTSGNLTLDIAYNGNTISGVDSTTSIASLAASVGGGSVGIKITGIKQKYDVNRWRQYNKVRFNVLLENFVAGINVATTGANEGTGVYEQVANDEYISWGDEGQVFVDQIPPMFREQDTVVGTQYNPVILGWLDKLNSLIGAGENRGSAILYISGAPGLTNQGLELIDVLNAWLTNKFANVPVTLV